jgi:hypothetical protein
MKWQLNGEICPFAGFISETMDIVGTGSQQMYRKHNEMDRKCSDLSFFYSEIPL